MHSDDILHGIDKHRISFIGDLNGCDVLLHEDGSISLHPYWCTNTSIKDGVYVIAFNNILEHGGVKYVGMIKEGDSISMLTDELFKTLSLV